MTGAIGRWFKVPPLGERLRKQGVREDVVAAAERTAYGRQTDRAVPALAVALSDDEVALQLVEARLGGRYGLFALTSRRLVFLPSEGPGVLTLDLPLTALRTVGSRKHRGLGIVQLDVAADVAEAPVIVDKILGNQADAIADRIRREIADPGPQMAPSARDPIEVLAELRAMHQAGLIDDAEFRIRKAELFGQI